VSPAVQLPSPLEAGFCHSESARTPIHIGSVGVFQGAPLGDRHRRLRAGAGWAKIESRLHLMPKVRRRVPLSNLGPAAAAWVDDLRGMPGPGLDVLAAGIVHSFSELIAVACIRSGSSPDDADETGIRVQGGSSS
jgi:hypothetical protein